MSKKCEHNQVMHRSIPLGGCQFKRISQCLRCQKVLKQRTIESHVWVCKFTYDSAGAIRGRYWKCSSCGKEKPYEE